MVGERGLVVLTGLQLEHVVPIIVLGGLGALGRGDLGGVALWSHGFGGDGRGRLPSGARGQVSCAEQRQGRWPWKPGSRSPEESASSSSSGPYVVDFGLGVDVYFILSVVVARHQHCIVGRILDCCCGRTPLPCICLGGLRIDFTFGLSSSFCVCRSPWVGRPGGCVGDLTSFAGDCPFRLSQKAERDEYGARGIVWMISG